MRLPSPPLLVISDRRAARAPLEAVAAACFAGGCRWFSLREKDLDPSARLALLARLVALGRGWGAAVMVHGDVAAARAAGAAGVHLPEGGDARAARARLGAAALIGVSAHTAEGAARAAAAGADYVTISPVFPSASKPGYGPVLGVAGLRAIAASAPLPVVALGGGDAAGMAACLAAGAAGVAMMGGVMAAESAGEATNALLAALSACPALPPTPAPPYPPPQ